MDINVTLLDPDGNALPVESVTVTQSINRGWTWSAVLSYMPHGYTVLEDTDRSLLDAFLEDATFTLTLTAGAHTLTLPPLVVQDWEEDHGTGGGVLSGIDLVMYRLTRSSHRMMGIQVTTSAAILEAIASDIDMYGKMSNYTSWSFPVCEVEDSGRTNMLVHVERLCAIACQEFRCTAASGGTLEFYPLDIWAAPSGTQPDWSSVVRRRAWSDRITSLDIVKTSRMTEAVVVHSALSNAGEVRPLGFSARHLQSTYPDVTFWDDDPDVNPSANQVGSGGFAYDEPVEATHFRVERDGSSFVIRGTGTDRLVPGTDLAFCVNHDSGIGPARPADEPWVEQWLPSQAYVEARTQTYLWARNRQTHTLSWEGPPCLWLPLGHVLTWPGCPDSRVESITHTLGPGQASTSVESAALGSAQW